MCTLSGISARFLLRLAALVLAAVCPLAAQQAFPQAPQAQVNLQMPPAPTANSGSEGKANPLPELTLDQAIAAAMQNDPLYAASAANRGTARLNHQLARGALLPSVNGYGQYLYTQPNGDVNPNGQPGLQELPIFIANNAVHEYMLQLMANETLSVGGFASLHQTQALASKAGADLEIARRDLILRVVQEYFGLLDAQQKARIARQTRDEAQRFLNLTQKLEAGQEVAEADVVAAQLGLQQKQRAYDNARLAAEQAQLNLGTLLFADPRTPYELSAAPPPLMTPKEQVEADAARR